MAGREVEVSCAVPEDGLGREVGQACSPADRRPENTARGNQPRSMMTEQLPQPLIIVTATMTKCLVGEARATPMGRGKEFASHVCPPENSAAPEKPASRPP